MRIAVTLGRVAARGLATALLCAGPSGVLQGQTTIQLPLGVGLRWPTYDRVDGLTLPLGPVVSAGRGRLRVDPVLAYRSHIGKVDPSLTLVLQRRDSLVGLVVSAARGTFTNERWIRGDLLNGLASFGLGSDARNYFRGDRAEARVVVRAPSDRDAAMAFAGVRFENDWSTGWRAGERRAPFSVLGRHDAENGIERPNPAIARGHLASVIAGGHLEYAGDSWHGAADVLAERGAPEGGTRFTQLTLGGDVSVPTLAGERLIASTHIVATGGGAAPPQRWSYLGGAGTLATVPLLSRGGDHLFFADAWYQIPVPFIDVPVLGTPWVAPRVAVGAAGVGGFGGTITNVGARIGVWDAYAELVVNPVSHRRQAGVGIALGY